MKIKKWIALLLAIAMLPVGQIVFAAENEAAGGNKAGWFIDAEDCVLSADAAAVSDSGAIGEAVVFLSSSESADAVTASFTVPEEASYYLY